MNKISETHYDNQMCAIIRLHAIFTILEVIDLKTQRAHDCRRNSRAWV